MTKMTVIVSVALVAVAIPSHTYCPTYTAAGIDKDAQIVPDTYFSGTFRSVLVTQCIEARPNSGAKRYEYVVESMDQDIGKELRVCETPELGRDQLQIFLPIWGYQVIEDAPNRKKCGRHCSDALMRVYCGIYEDNLEFTIRKVAS